MKTIVGLFPTMSRAQEVRQALLDAGLSQHEVSVMDSSKQSYTGNYTQAGTEHESLGDRIKHFFSGFGEDDYSGHQAYTHGVEQGGAIVSVRAEDAQAADVADLLHSYGAQEVEDSYSGESWQHTGSATGDDVIPVVREELQVGKREVNRGGVRVYSHVVSEPVSEDVKLREERVYIERRPVDRAATAADLAPRPEVVELTAVGEEAIVGKQSRVVEEVHVGKQVAERTETVRDTVRRTEVEVDPLTAGAEKAGY